MPLVTARHALRRHQWKDHGLTKGVYRGFLITCLRDVPAFGLYFSSYHWFKDLFSASPVDMSAVDDVAAAHMPSSVRNTVDMPPPMLHGLRLPSFRESLPMLMAGGIAGTLSWVVCVPFDVVKSCVQGQPLTTQGERASAMFHAKDGYRNEGIVFFTRGTLATVVRAFPVSAVTFYVYEVSFQLMGDS